jgi:predicted hydrocarbon binding protein
MADRNKDVIVFRYDPRKRYFLVSLSLKNVPGALGNVANLLGIRGINILEGYFGGISSDQGVLSFFLETTNQRMDAAWLKDFLETSVDVSEVEVRSGTEGFLADSVNFPITWNNGDRAVLMRVEGLRVMLDGIMAANPEMGEKLVYTQGFNYGRAAWENLFQIHRPDTKEGVAEMLNVYFATGWGKPELMEFNPGQMKAKVRMGAAFECDGRTTGRPEGRFVSGHLAGCLSAYFDTELGAVESHCVSKGDSHCEFEISPMA